MQIFGLTFCLIKIIKSSTKFCSCATHLQTNKTFIMPNHTNTHDLMAAELGLEDLWIALLQFKISDVVLALDLKNRRGSADVKRAYSCSV